MTALTEDRTTFRPELVATDIDGTIVPIGGTLSERTRATLHACVAAGVDVVLVTGRPPRWLPPVADALELPATAICANGSIVIDTETYAVRDITPVPGGVAAEAVTRLQRLVPDAVFGVESPSVLRAGPGYERVRSTRSAEGMAPRTRSVLATSSVEEMLDDEIVKLVLISPGADPDALLRLVRDEVGDVLSTTRSAVGRALIELGPLGVTKASALAAYAASRGVGSDGVVAFGDMPNDVEMLGWAGRGYAMSGAHPDAAAAASRTAPPAAEDGVAQVLEAMLALRVAA